MDSRGQPGIFLVAGSFETSPAKGRISAAAALRAALVLEMGGQVHPREVFSICRPFFFLLSILVSFPCG